MEKDEITSEEYIEISEKVRSGEYFREARNMVDIDLHDPMAERYWYISITFIAILIAYIALEAWQGFYPLKPRVPFMFSTNDAVEDVPTLKTLVNYHNENADVALRRFLVQNYVKTREEYDAATFDRNHNAVESLSVTKVLREYEDSISPKNPNSPIALYQRHTRRIITITGSQILEDNSGSGNKDNKTSYKTRVFFESRVKRGENQNPPTKHQVDVAFQYKDIKLDQETGKITPYGFIVTDYGNYQDLN